MVDDCSQDGTQTLLREKISAVVARVTYDPVNRGKGAALRSRLSSAFAAARVRQSGRRPWLRFMGGRPHRVFFLTHGR
jgi:glycosyltransferase involved in cell wall biosynthesis